MRMTKIQSSYIEAIAFLEDEEVLLVKLKDGTLVAKLRVSIARYCAFLEAGSRGAFFQAMPEPTVAIRNPGAPAIAQEAAPPAPRPAPMTVDQMLKVKAGDPPAGCDFAVVGRNP